MCGILGELTLKIHVLQRWHKSCGIYCYSLHMNLPIYYLVVENLRKYTKSFCSNIIVIFHILQCTFGMCLLWNCDCEPKFLSEPKLNKILLLQLEKKIRQIRPIRPQPVNPLIGGSVNRSVGLGCRNGQSEHIRTVDGFRSNPTRPTREHP